MRQRFILSLSFCLLFCFELIIAPPPSHPTIARTTSKGSNHGGSSHGGSSHGGSPSNAPPSLTYSPSFDKTKEATKHLSDDEVRAKGSKQFRHGLGTALLGKTVGLLGGTAVGAKRVIGAKIRGESGRQAFKKGYYEGRKPGAAIAEKGGDAMHLGNRHYDVVTERHNPGYMAPPPEIAHNLAIRKQALADAEAAAVAGHGNSH